MEQGSSGWRQVAAKSEARCFNSVVVDHIAVCFGLPSGWRQNSIITLIKFHVIFLKTDWKNSTSFSSNRIGKIPRYFPQIRLEKFHVIFLNSDWKNSTLFLKSDWKNSTLFSSNQIGKIPRYFSNQIGKIPRYFPQIRLEKFHVIFLKSVGKIPRYFPQIRLESHCSCRRHS